MDQQHTARTEYESIINLMHTKQPQEIFDQIAENVFEMIFLPGYVEFSNNKTFNSDTARQELLLLSKDIYRRFHIRMWTENICTVTTDQGRRFEIHRIEGHLSEVPNYLASIIADQFPHLRQTQSKHHLRDSLISNTIYDVPIEDQFGYLKLDHDNHYDWLMILFEDHIKYMKIHPISDFFFHSTDQYGPTGEWLGLEWQTFDEWKVFDDWPEPYELAEECIRYYVLTCKQVT
ncbi:MAG: hypothetical protein Q9186_000715 [Xanthomendoza sp. 1 TL-2023]